MKNALREPCKKL